jgi:hypothetical protein
MGQILTIDELRNVVQETDKIFPIDGEIPIPEMQVFTDLQSVITALETHQDAYYAIEPEVFLKCRNRYSSTKCRITLVAKREYRELNEWKAVMKSLGLEIYFDSSSYIPADIQRLQLLAQEQGSMPVVEVEVEGDEEPGRRDESFVLIDGFAVETANGQVKVSACPKCMTINLSSEERCKTCLHKFSVQVCPGCSKRIHAENEECPHCHYQLVEASEEIPVMEVQSVVKSKSAMICCPDCGEEVPLHLVQENCTCPDCEADLFQCPHCRAWNVGSVDSDNTDQLCSSCDKHFYKSKCPECHVIITADLEECPHCQCKLSLITCPHEDCQAENDFTFYKGLKECPFCEEEVEECPHCHSWIPEVDRDEDEDSQYCQECNKFLFLTQCPHCQAEITADLTQCPRCQQKVSNIPCPHEDCGADNDFTFYKGLKECPYCEEEVEQCPHCQHWIPSVDHEDCPENLTCPECSEYLYKTQCPHCQAQIVADLNTCPHCQQKLETIECPAEGCELNEYPSIYKGLNQCPSCEEEITQCVFCKVVIPKQVVIDEEDCPRCGESYKKENCPHCGSKIFFGYNRCPDCKKTLNTIECPNCEEWIFEGCTLCTNCEVKLQKCQSCRSWFVPDSQERKCEDCLDD